MKLPKKYKILWSGRGVDYSSKEIKAVVDAMKKADPLTQGKYLKEFEDNFASYLKAKNCFAVSSCTAALELASILCNLRKEDEVIIPAHTFCATAIPFARRAKIVWADIDKDTRTVSVDTIRKCVTDKTKVIVVVHLYGLMADMEKISNFAKEKKLLLVEDVAQAIGAEQNGKRAGTFGDFGCFSFHGQKNLTTLGEGGVLVVKSDELAKMLPGIRHNGVRDYPGSREKYWLPAMSDVDFDIENFWPYNFCIGEIQCALGTELLKTIDKQNEKRRERAQKFILSLENFPELSFQKVEEKKMHVYHLLSAKYDGHKFGRNRDDLMKLLVEKYRIKPVVQYYPLYRYPMFKKGGLGNAHCPDTDDFFDNMISFPFHLWMSEKDFDYMIDSTKKALKELRKI